MEKKSNFGEIYARSLNIGDIVEWSKWDSDYSEWIVNYGIVISVKNEIKSNRLVSISRVMPFNDNSMELEFFTLSLRLVSPSLFPNTIQ